MMKKILVPFDGSETALRALEFAAGIGKPFGSEIMVVNVIVPYDYTKVPPRKPKNAIEEAEMAAKEPDPIKNKLKITEDQVVEIMKSGVSNAHMIFEKNKKNQTYYSTPYGQMLVGVNTKEMKVDIKENT